MSDDKTQDAINRGKRAALLLEDDLLASAFVELETAYIRGWRDSRALDTEAREKLWQALQIVGKVREHLHHVLGNGKMAQLQLDQLSKPATHLRAV